MPLPTPLLNGTTRAYDIGRLFQMTPMEPVIPGERRILGLVLPHWQRPEVWTNQQKVRFVEGIFHGFGTGYYVTNGQDWKTDGSRKPMSGWLLDGQQRISAIRDFVHGKLTIFDDVTYGSLSEPECRRFLRKNFDCFELEYSDDEDRLKDLYDRMNFGGTPHEQHQRAAHTRHGEEARQEFLACVNSFAQDDATGKAYCVLRNEQRDLEMRSFSPSGFRSMAQLFSVEPDTFTRYEMVVIDSGNSHGDSWIATFYPKQMVFSFVDEHLDCQSEVYEVPRG